MARVRVKPYMRHGTLVLTGHRAPPGKGVSVYGGRYKRKRRGRRRR